MGILQSGLFCNLQPAVPSLCALTEREGGGRRSEFDRLTRNEGAGSICLRKLTEGSRWPLGSIVLQSIQYAMVRSSVAELTHSASMRCWGTVRVTTNVSEEDGHDTSWRVSTN
jgi:hypothetical protein